MQYNLWDRNVPESRELSDSELDRVRGGDDLLRYAVVQGVEKAVIAHGNSFAAVFCGA
jgi:hypothetical protein